MREVGWTAQQISETELPGGPGGRTDVDKAFLGSATYRSLGEQQLSPREEAFEKGRRTVGLFLAPLVTLVFWFLPLDLGYDDLDWSCRRYAETGAMMPEDGLDQLASYDAILLGAVGWPGVPDHVSLWGLLIPIRRHFRQYVTCGR